MKRQHYGQDWLGYAPRYITGKSFIRLIQLRIGKLAILENTNRGREADKKCRKCHRVNESLNHILSNCHYTHFARMQRHDGVAKLFTGACEESGHRVLWEPHLLVGNQLHKPDLVVVDSSTNTSWVIDFSIVTERQFFEGNMTTLNDIWQTKHDKYDTPAIDEHVSTLSVRGIWCSRNDNILKELSVSKHTRELIVVRAMKMGVKA